MLQLQKKKILILHQLTLECSCWVDAVPAAFLFCFYYGHDGAGQGHKIMQSTLSPSSAISPAASPTRGQICVVDTVVPAGSVLEPAIHIRPSVSTIGVLPCSSASDGMRP